MSEEKSITKDMFKEATTEGLDVGTSTKQLDSDDNNDKNPKEEDSDDGDEAGIMEMLQNFLASKLNLNDSKDEPPVLTSPSIDAVVEYILSGKCKSIITMAGAGISTSAGIPDFRSPGSGLYHNLAKYELPHPEAIFDIDFFKENPKPFFVLAKELYPGEFNPTPSHYFIKLLHEKGLLLRHYTQNIDTLEHIAGIPADRIVEAHGTFRTSHCLGCRKEYSQQWIKEEIFKDNVPKCTECEGLVKPDIIFFKEGLPPRFFQLLGTDFPKCDLLIIMGTSLTVQPFASIVGNVPTRCPRLLINREKVGTSDYMMAALEGLFNSPGLNLDSPKNTRDVAILGDCDDGCIQLVEKLGWKDDLDKLIQSTKSSAPPPAASSSSK